MNAVCITRPIVDLHIATYKIQAQYKLNYFSLWLLVLVRGSLHMLALLEVYEIFYTCFAVNASISLP